MLKKIFNLKPKHQTLTAILFGLAVISFWDLYLFPNYLALSYASSFIIGFGILYIAHKIVKVMS